MKSTAYNMQMCWGKRIQGRCDIEILFRVYFDFFRTYQAIFFFSFCGYFDCFDVTVASVLDVPSCQWRRHEVVKWHTELYNKVLFNILYNWIPKRKIQWWICKELSWLVIVNCIMNITTNCTQSYHEQSLS